jgi:hypothetical protein
VETYPRLMFLKFRYRLGYETLCAEVAASISRRRSLASTSTLGCPTPHYPDEDHHSVR